VDRWGCASLALAVSLAVLLSRRRAIFQTTLTGAWWWSVAALVAASVVEMGPAIAPAASIAALLAPLRLAVLALGLCPVVALLGAKRPQQRAWNFVVLSLWGVVALPAAEAFYLHPGRTIDVGAVRSWFLWILILLPPINFLPTRFALASLVLFAGQLVAASPHLALIRRPLTPQPELVGLALIAAALAIAWLLSRRATVAVNAYDGLWLDFRDTFGLFWALRVQERVNSAARQSGWGIALTWTGFRSADTGKPLTEISASIEPALRTTFKGLLRRFVSTAWITARLERR
jgi:hypothetical protein